MIEPTPQEADEIKALFHNLCNALISLGVAGGYRGAGQPEKAPPIDVLAVVVSLGITQFLDKLGINAPEIIASLKNQEPEGIKESLLSTLAMHLEPPSEL